MAASGDPPVRVVTKEITAGGARLCQHWEWGSAIGEIRSGKWDLVVLEEDPYMELWPEEKADYQACATKFHEEIAKVGAQTILYMTWPDRVEGAPTTEEMAAVVDKMGAELGAKVAPVGLAFARAMQERPEMDMVSSDGDHQSVYGYYLLLSVLYATILDRSPEGLTYRMADMVYDGMWGSLWQISTCWQLPDQDAAFLQRIAWETVQAHQAGGTSSQ
jgi:hypothetical protein